MDSAVLSPLPLPLLTLSLENVDVTTPVAMTDAILDRLTTMAPSVDAIAEAVRPRYLTLPIVVNPLAMALVAVILWRSVVSIVDAAA